jgi:hypothetical protein
MSYNANDKDSAEHVEHEIGVEKHDAVNAVLAGQVHDMTIEDRATALKLAQQADPGPAAFSYRSFVFTCMVLVVCMCSGDSGTLADCR